ncbi:hypothetical protein BDN72DRAFT_896922 [Pluteus cervinus]|uniref:Uncharacterized protein n=1 Tax=Pluteus cervinus TaxID=181527 RepID=A0ACD3AVW1_9AGAR|nr:hypothetical protein BDN72DRAFT_896922 [Pluteus cervinus]
MPLPTNETQHWRQGGSPHPLSIHSDSDHSSARADAASESESVHPESEHSDDGSTIVFTPPPPPPPKRQSKKSSSGSSSKGDSRRHSQMTGVSFASVPPPLHPDHPKSGPRSSQSYSSRSGGYHSASEHFDHDGERRPLLPQHQPKEPPPEYSPGYYRRLKQAYPFIILLLIVLFAYVSSYALTPPKEDICDPETRDRYKQEMQRQREEFSKEKEGWERERKDHEVEHTQIHSKRLEWRAEERKHEAEEAEWKNAEEEHGVKKKKWEEEEKEIEMRKKSYHWGYAIPGDRCQGYALREWSAELAHVPKGYDDEEGCYATPIDIQGLKLPGPDYCTNVGRWGTQQYLGHWKVDHDAGCTTFWENWQDKGCTGEGTGKHRYEAHLGNLRPNDDGAVMCASTPGVYKGRTFMGPKSCAYWGRYGWWGIWEMDDSQCAPKPNLADDEYNLGES